ncbi:PKD domain-containing protein [Candidatus Halobeggiatoa sp. HSG11]|nr:PKD domain-containing protein [Candidatus Halobeggiatoa sp. HSG11]
MKINTFANCPITGSNINCNSNNCEEQYPENTTINLLVEPKDGYEFGGWNGVCSSSNADCSRNGKIIDYVWKSSDKQDMSGKQVEITFAKPETYNLTLTVTGENDTKDEVTKTIHFDNKLVISGMKDVYHVDEHIVVDLIENIEKNSRSERVDLWVVIQMSDGNFIYRVNDLNPFSFEQKAFLTSLQTSKLTHRIFDFQLTPGSGGDYTIYAAYVEEGKNPMTDGHVVLRSNIVIRHTILSNRADIDLN